MSSELHAVTGCKKVYAGKVFECQTNSMEAKKTQRLGMAVAGIAPTASHLTKIGKMQLAGCRLCFRTLGL